MIHDSLNLKIVNDLTEVTRVAARIEPLLNRWSLDDTTAYRVQLVLEEVLTNVIRHGCADSKDPDISVAISFDGEVVDIRVCDDGAEFNPLDAPEADVNAPLEERPIGGLGVHLVRTFAREMDYRRVEGRNELRVRV